MGIFDNAGSSSSQAFTQTQLPPEYIQDASIQLLNTVGGTQGIPGLIDQPYENYNELGQAGVVDPRLAGFSPDQIQAFDLANQGVGAYQPYMTNAATAAGGTAGVDMLQQGSQYGDLSPYQNPYQTSVIDTTMQEMVRQQEMQQDKLDSQAARAQSYGGSRHGVAEAEMEKGHDLNRAMALSQLNQAGYDAAQRAQESHRGRQLQAGLGMGQLGLDTARVQGTLGGLQQQYNMADINTLGATGALQQGQLQKQYDINYNQWLDEYQDPYKRAGFYSDIIQGVPSTSSVMQAGTIAQPSTLSQGIGALGQVAGAGQTFGWWGNQES